jgi:hypothetical protein
MAITSLRTLARNHPKRQHAHGERARSLEKWK